MSVKLTTTYWKIRKLTKKFRVIQGGQGASKTFSILISLVEYAINNPQARITVVTSTFPLLTDGVIADMEQIYLHANLNFSNDYNKSSKNLSFENGSVIQFRNLDAIDVHKGKGARRDILFCNESNRLTYATLDPLIVRTDKYVIFDFNPDSEFWLHTNFVNTSREDVDFLIVTYKDNEMIPDGEKEEIERRIVLSEEPNAPESLKNWVNIYAYGNVGSYSDRRIYDFEIKEIPTTAKKIHSGMDFGKSPDRTALVNLYIDGVNLYAEEVFCMNNLESEKIQGSERMSVVDQMDFIKFPKGQLIIADSAGATQIGDMRKHEYNVIAVKKTRGGIINGINKVRSYKLHITPDSPNLKKDLEQFFWKVNKDGIIIPEMDGHEPDTVVCIRYGMMAHCAI